MTEQMLGELLYEYTIQSTGGCPRWTLCCPVWQTSARSPSRAWRASRPLAAGRTRRSSYS
jgi:hypothetical protein